MQITMVLYRRMTALDIVGPYEVLSRLPGAEITFAAAAPGPIPTDTGLLNLPATADFAEISRTDLVVVPGGPDVRAQTQDTRLHEWLREIDRTTTWTTSVCTGSLILAAAGLLERRRATTHWLVKDRLGDFGAEPAPGRVVIDGKYGTAAGVSAGIDLALTLAARIAGERIAQTIQLAIEYDPRPPFDAGSPDTAPEEVTDFLRSNRSLVVES
ncbi:DJ-1/PfpI family protein [Dactylosporangium salmoneum]|uniref:DJ-1/PfpI family protein n=1 Tax=Dactylosporangium salmoneum TaxID=53361 RepID=A0ABP5T271_9ACTN